MIDIDNELSLKASREELASVYKKMEDWRIDQREIISSFGVSRKVQKRLTIP